MIKRGHLNVPVIGVAKAGWNLEQLRARAKDSLEKHGGNRSGGVREASRLAALCRWRLYRPRDLPGARKELDGAQHPAHYLAIPPVLFGMVVEQLAKSGSAQGARVIVEKPFGHDLASAQQLNRILLATFPRAPFFASTTTWASGR